MGNSKTITGGSQNIVLGDANTLSQASRNFIAGSNNVLGAGIQDAQVIGSGVTVGDGVQNVVAIGSGASVTASNAVALGAGSVADQADTVSVGASGSERRITNVADGVNGNDAVNVSQLNQKIALAASGAGQLVYDDVDAKDQVTLAGANGSVIANVTAGTQATDAANVSQVQGAVAAANAHADAGDQQTLQQAKTYADNGDQQVLQQARAYTDQRLGDFASRDDLNDLRQQTNDRFNTVDRRINRVGAMGAAMAQMSFSAQGIDTTNRLGVGVGGYRGQAALSVGYSRRVAPNANITVGAAVAGSESSGGVGLGFGW
jgi:autotransporter adhesin